MNTIIATTQDNSRQQQTTRKPLILQGLRAEREPFQLFQKIQKNFSSAPILPPFCAIIVA